MNKSDQKMKKVMNNKCFITFTGSVWPQVGKCKYLNIINMNNHEYSWTKGDNHSDMQNPKRINKLSSTPKIILRKSKNMNNHLEQYRLMGDNYTKP